MNQKLEQSLQIRKFNPGTFQSDREVMRQFVVRNSELDLLMEVLRGNLHSPSCQHVLLHAPRGRGKTMMLARVAAELRTNGDLSSLLLPVRFMEESHEVFSLADFWLETLFHLARELAVPDPGFSRELHDVHRHLAEDWDARDLEERARATVLEAADRLGKRLVLMVENLQDLIGDVGDDFGWRLRKTLQTEPQIILLATATCRFKELDNAEHAFFELFRVVHLEPLDTEDCRRLWKLASGKKAKKRGVRPLQILTGGDPRLLVMIGEFARHRSLRQLMEELVRLLDDHTEYFRGHLETFAKTERRVYIALIDLWQPSTTAEIASRARLDIRSVSSLLGRLVVRGAVVFEGGGRTRTYAAAQRLYSIYYKLRRERDEASVVRNLIYFMAVFYSTDELNAWGHTLELESRASPMIREGLKLAAAESPQIGELLSVSEWAGALQAESTAKFTDPENVQHRIEEFLSAFKEGDSRKILQIAERSLSSLQAGEVEASDDELSFTLFSKAFAHRKLGEAVPEMAAYDELIDRFLGNLTHPVQKIVAAALVFKAIRQAELGDTAASFATVYQLVDQFEKCDEPNIDALVADALLGKLQELALRDNPEEAINTLDKLISRFENDTKVELKVLTAKAMGAKVNALWAIGKSETAEAAFKQLYKKFDDCSSREVQLQVAKQMTQLGINISDLGNIQTAIVTLNDVVEKFGGKGDPEILVQVELASIWKGILHALLATRAEAAKKLTEVIERFGDRDARELQLGVAVALNFRGQVQRLLGDSHAAIESWNEVILRIQPTRDPEFGIHLTSALIHKATEQAHVGRTEEAFKTCDMLEKIPLASMLESNTEFACMALWVKSKIHLIRENHSAALEAFRSMYSEFDPERDFQASQMIALACDMSAAGISDGELVKTLSSDKQKAEALLPLVVALRQQMGERVRAPSEILEVATDIQKMISDEGARHKFFETGVFWGNQEVPVSAIALEK